MPNNMSDSSQIMNADIQTQSLNGALLTAVSGILKTLIRILLRHGVPFQGFADLAKRAYVEVARENFGLPGRKSTASRVAVLTGLTRKDIQKLIESASMPDTEAAERYNRAARVVSGWIRDRDFSDVGAQPFPLPLDGANGTFADLVRRYSGDMPPRAVLDELLRVGAVEKLEDGRVKLVARAYIPRSSDSDKLAILGSDVADLIDTIDHNLQHTEGPRFQRKLMYDNLSREGVVKFRELSAARAQGLMEYLDSWLSQHDRDVNPTAEGTGRVRAGLGVFYFEQNLEANTKEK